MFLPNVHHPRMDDLQAIALAYRSSRLKDPWHHPAYLAAERAYREAHPEAPDYEVKRRVPRLIFAAAEKYGAWLYGR